MGKHAMKEPALARVWVGWAGRAGLARLFWLAPAIAKGPVPVQDIAVHELPAQARETRG